MGFGNLGASEILVIFLVVLILFGSKRLPEFGRSLGTAIREFKKSMKEIEHDVDAEKPAKPPEPEPPANRPIA